MPEAVQINRDVLIKECGRSIACIHAVEYYIKYIQNPCHPPGRGLTTKARKYYIELLDKHGRPQCDVKTLVYNTLLGSELEDLAEKAAELADKIKKEMNLTSRVAAAVAVVVAAIINKRYVSKYKVAAMFGISPASLNEFKIRSALKIAT
ncbi:MAG: hypothetical protein ACO2PN_15980 [Pyrobaculum sp.]|jgi:hypothetical protein